MRRIFALLLVTLVGLLSTHAATAESIPLYVGTAGDGIFLTQFDPDRGTLSEPIKVATTVRPTFIWIHGATNSLYSISEQSRGENAQGAAIVAWAIDRKTGKLSMRSQQDAGGDGPCFVSVSGDGKYAAVANYGGGSVSLFPLAADGSVEPASTTIQHVGSSINPRRQGEPHAHSSRFDPTDRRVLAADLGTDKVYIYDIGKAGSLTPADPPAIDAPAGSGPRHFVFSPDQQNMLILGELSGTITTVRYAPPKITMIATVSTMADDTPNDAPRGSAEILFHPNGKWVYCTNRGPSEIAVFDYDATSGKLSRTSAVSSGGKHPRNFRISPDGRFLLCANQQTSNIVVFSIDQTSGKLTKSTELAVDKPMCLKFFMAE